MTTDLILDPSGFTVADKTRTGFVDSASLPPQITFDMKGDHDTPVGYVTATGTLPAGRNLNPPLNIPRGGSVVINWRRPGTETITHTGFEVHTRLPIWELGKSYQYLITRTPVDINPANDIYILTATTEGGQPAQNVYYIPPVGVEIIAGWRGPNQDEPIYRQFFEGVADVNAHTLGGPVSGIIGQTISAIGGLQSQAQANQQSILTFVGADDGNFISVQKHLETWRLLLGDNNVGILNSYWIHIDYTKG